MDTQYNGKQDFNKITLQAFIDLSTLSKHRAKRFSTHKYNLANMPHVALVHDFSLEICPQCANYNVYWKNFKGEVRGWYD